MTDTGVIYTDAGTIAYRECWDMQQRIFDSLVAAKTPSADGGKGVAESCAHPTLLLCEHPHVYTLGRSGLEDNMLIGEEFLRGIGATFHRTDRGGDVTYHGPGQLVGYPILDLDRLGMGLKAYIHALEQTLIDTVARFGIEGTRVDGAAGVWLHPSGGKGLRKIAAIGVRSSRFVTMHGFALNVSPAMEYFSYINPCGFTDRGVTSVSGETGTEVGMPEMKRIYGECFEKVFGVTLMQAPVHVNPSSCHAGQGCGENK